MSLKISNFRAVSRPQAAVEKVLDDLENEDADRLHLRSDGIAKSLMMGKTILQKF